MAGTPLRLLDYLDRRAVATGLRGKDKEEALSLLVEFVVGRKLAHDASRLLTALRQREDIVSTGIGNGVAIPHADLPEIDSPRLALGIFPEGVEFQAIDEDPVTVVFLLLGTPRTPGLHMKILARIARLSKDPVFAELSGARSPEDAVAVLERLEAEH